MIRNTSDAMKDPAEAMLMLAVSMGPGGSDRAIEEQERAGQAQLVTSEQLPTELTGGSQADFEALGFVFGDVTPGDPLFRAATLPKGWKREASEHSMWSYVIDEHGRRRVSIFYKAAFYDRSAHARLTSLTAYVAECQGPGREIITDATWATPGALADAARQLARSAQESADEWTEIGERSASTRGDTASERGDKIAATVAQYAAEREAYEALAARFGEAAAE